MVNVTGLIVHVRDDVMSKIKFLFCSYWASKEQFGLRMISCTCSMLCDKEYRPLTRLYITPKHRQQIYKLNVKVYIYEGIKM